MNVRDPLEKKLKSPGVSKFSSDCANLVHSWSRYSKLHDLYQPWHCRGRAFDPRQVHQLNQIYQPFNKKSSKALKKSHSVYSILFRSEHTDLQLECANAQSSYRFVFLGKLSERIGYRLTDLEGKSKCCGVSGFNPPVSYGAEMDLASPRSCQLGSGRRFFQIHTTDVVPKCGSVDGHVARQGYSGEHVRPMLAIGGSLRRSRETGRNRLSTVGIKSDPHFSFWPVAELAQRPAVNRKIVGSNPTWPAKFKNKSKINGGTVRGGFNHVRSP